jgi:molecular chaperone HtpG
VLFFPKLKQNMELQKNKIHLYSNQVFITDNVENIVPDFLTLLHGVIDSPDIPLNVSRSYLQEDSNVKKISAHITKKVADKLNAMFTSDRSDFESKWESIRVFIEYGMLTDEKFFDKGLKFGLFKSTDGKFSTLDEMKERLAVNQKDKNGKTVVLYTADPILQHDRITKAKAMGYEVVVLEGPLAAHIMQRLESHDGDLQFRRVDSDTLSKLIEKEETPTSLLSEAQEQTLKPIIESVAGNQQYKVQFAPMSVSEQPMVVTQSEFMRRMKEQQMAGGGGFNVFGDLPDTYNLVVNSNHPLIEKIASLTDADKQKSHLKQLTDLALLSNGLLKGEALSQFVERSVDLIEA